MTVVLKDKDVNKCLQDWVIGSNPADLTYLKLQMISKGDMAE